MYPLSHFGVHPQSLFPSGHSKYIIIIIIGNIPLLGNYSVRLCLAVASLSINSHVPVKSSSYSHSTYPQPNNVDETMRTIDVRIENDNNYLQQTTTIKDNIHSLVLPNS